LLFVVVVVFHVVICLALIMVVLLQSSKGEGLAGSAFGGSGGLSGAVFGGRGAGTFLSKATTWLAVLFMVNCVALAFMSSSNRPAIAVSGSSSPDESVVTREAQAERERAMEMQRQQQEQQLMDSLQSETPIPDAPDTGM